jgi:valyl-tRNA synthetase
VIGTEVRASGDRRAIIEKYQAIIDRQAKITTTLATGGGPVPGAAKAIVGSDIEVVMPLGGLIDFAAERARITKEVGKADKEIATIEKKLANEDFVAKAAPEVVEENKARLVEEKARRQRLVDALATLGGAS